MPTFSIIVPVYNRAATLPRLFTSLMAQKYAPLEVILVDNNSTDESLHLCQQFQEERESASLHIIVTTETKQTASAARNKGAALAQGEYLYFFDSDDEISPYFLSDAAQYLGADLICAPTLMVFPDGSTQKRNAPRRSPFIGHLIAATFSTQTMVIRKELFHRVRGWNEDLLQWDDWEFATRLLLQRPSLKWIETQQPYHRIYQHDDSISGAKIAAHEQHYVQALTTVWQHLQASAFSQKDKERQSLALYCKALLLSALSYKESKTMPIAFHQTIPLPAAYAHLRKWLRLFYFLDKKGIPGIWRIYYFLCRSFR